MHIEGGRIFDVSLRKSVPLGATKRVNADKSTELAADMQAFLLNGGKITEVPGFTPIPKRPHTKHDTAKPRHQPVDDHTLLRQKGSSAIGWPEALEIKDKLFGAELTYKSLAEIVGVPKGTLSHWFQKLQIPSKHWKARVNEGLNILLAKHGKSRTTTTR